MSGDRDLSPREARDRFIARRETENTEETVRSYRNRLTRFVEWCDERDVESMSELTGWDLDEYRAHCETSDVAPSTVRGYLDALRQLLGYCEDLGVVEDDFADKLNVPTLDKAEESSDQRLAHADARRLLEFYRDSQMWYGTPEHALLEVAWHVGARMKAIRALDLEDFDEDARTLTFLHRPTAGTGLKNKADSERVVGISQNVVDALQAYIARERFDKRDDHGRSPLFATRQGRASKTSFRAWSYLGTQPCVVVGCPHGNRRETCKYVHRNHASKCPSSRALHAVRTGSITWQYLQGLDIEDIAKRVDATPKTLREHYLKPELLEEFKERRAETTHELDIEENDS